MPAPKQKSKSHEFTIYWPPVSDIKDAVVELSDKQLVHRIKNILRLRPGDSLTLFNTRHHLICIIEKIHNASILLRASGHVENRTIEPDVLWGLPILKRPALVQAVYSLTELGCQSVQLLSTDKSQSGQHVRLDRLEQICIAAAEQSKQFILPRLLPPKPLVEWIKDVSAQDTHKIFFDPDGAPPRTLIEQHTQKRFMCLSGPEGDLTSAEKKALIANGFALYSLTETVLRAEQAVALGLGLIRMLFKT